MKDWQATLLVALIALAGAAVVAAWQFGGHLSARRRALAQEFETLAKIPVGFDGRVEYERHLTAQLRAYIAWTERPMWRRLGVLAFFFAGCPAFLLTIVKINHPDVPAWSPEFFILAFGMVVVPVGVFCLGALILSLFSGRRGSKGT